MWPVENKTILGLKYSRKSVKKEYLTVENKTILGLKLLKKVWREYKVRG